MCQLLGMNAAPPTDVMFSFTGLATRADEHKDGFGIAFFEDRGPAPFIDHHSARRRRWPPWSALPDPQRQRHRPHPQGHAGRVALENTPLRARAVGPLLGVRAQRRPEGTSAAPARRLPPGGRHRQRTRLLLADAGAGQGHAGVPPHRRAQRARWRTAAATCRATAPSTCCCPTARRCGRMPRPGCAGCSAPPVRRAATLADEDLSVDFGALTTPTTAWPWSPPRRADVRRALAAVDPGELRSSFDGAAPHACCRHGPVIHPVPRFDQFYRHPELTRLLQDYAAARQPVLPSRSLDRQEPRGRDIWLRGLHAPRHRPDQQPTNRRSGSTATSTPPS